MLRTHAMHSHLSRPPGFFRERGSPTGFFFRTCFFMLQEFGGSKNRPVLPRIHSVVFVSCLWFSFYALFVLSGNRPVLTRFKTSRIHAVALSQRLLWRSCESFAFRPASARLYLSGTAGSPERRRAGGRRAVRQTSGSPGIPCLPSGPSRAGGTGLPPVAAQASFRRPRQPLHQPALSRSPSRNRISSREDAPDGGVDRSASALGRGTGRPPAVSEGRPS